MPVDLTLIWSTNSYSYIGLYSLYRASFFPTYDIKVSTYLKMFQKELFELVCFFSSFYNFLKDYGSVDLLSHFTFIKCKSKSTLLTLNTRQHLCVIIHIIILWGQFFQLAYFKLTYLCTFGSLKMAYILKLLYYTPSIMYDSNFK